MWPPAGARWSPSSSCWMVGPAWRRGRPRPPTGCTWPGWATAASGCWGGGARPPEGPGAPSAHGRLSQVVALQVERAGVVALQVERVGVAALQVERVGVAALQVERLGPAAAPPVAQLQLQVERANPAASPLGARLQVERLQVERL